MLFITSAHSQFIHNITFAWKRENQKRGVKKTNENCDIELKVPTGLFLMNILTRMSLVSSTLWQNNVIQLI